MILFFDYLVTLRNVIRFLKVKPRSVHGCKKLLLVSVCLLFAYLYLKIGVKILGDSDTYKGVLLHTDFPSKIAFVKILCRKQLRLRVPKWGKLSSRRKGDQVVGAGCNWDGNWKDSVFGYSLGVFSSIDDNKEKTESHNAWTSGRLIKASCGIGKPGNGGALVSLNGEVLGVIQDVRNWQIEATPIEDVLKYLEYSEKHGEHAEDM